MVFTRLFGWLASLSFLVPVVAAEPRSSVHPVVGHDSAPPFVVLSDREVAAKLGETEEFGAVEVLIRDPDETDRAINDRGLSVRDARYFVFCSSHGSLLASMYRERFEAQGTVVIDLHAWTSRRSTHRRPTTPSMPVTEQVSLASVLRAVP